MTQDVTARNQIEQLTEQSKTHSQPFQLSLIHI